MFKKRRTRNRTGTAATTHHIYHWWYSPSVGIFWQFYIHLSMRMSLSLTKVRQWLSIFLPANHAESNRSPVAPALYCWAGIEPALLESAGIEPTSRIIGAPHRNCILAIYLSSKGADPLMIRLLYFLSQVYIFRPSQRFFKVLWVLLICDSLARSFRGLHAS